MSDDDKGPVDTPEQPPADPPKPESEAVPQTTAEAENKGTSSLEELGAIMAGGFAALGEKLDKIAGSQDTTPTDVPWTHRGGRRRNA